jgi:hypothetical protein
MGIKPLTHRPSYKEDRDHPLTLALRDLRVRHGLTGAVLISFYADRIGVDSAACTPEFAAAMHRLGDQILMAIDDGMFDPTPQAKKEAH